MAWSILGGAGMKLFARTTAYHASATVASFIDRSKEKTKSWYESCTSHPVIEVIMQHKHLQFGHGFHVVLGDEHSQAAQMTLAPDETEGGPENHHKDQADGCMSFPARARL